MPEYQDCNAVECVDAETPHPQKRGKTLLETIQENGDIGPPTEADKAMMEDLTESPKEEAG